MCLFVSCCSSPQQVSPSPHLMDALRHPWGGPICSQVSAVSLGSSELAGSSSCSHPPGQLQSQHLWPTTVTTPLLSVPSLPPIALGQVNKPRVSKQPPGLRCQAVLLPATLQIFPRRGTLGLPSLIFKERNYLSTSLPSSMMKGRETP